MVSKISKWFPHIAVGVVGFLLIAKLGKVFSAGGIFQDNEEVQEKKKKDLIETKIDQRKMSKTMLAINNIANGLYQAMQDLGTNESRIFALLEGLNAEDLRAVWKTFGIREDSLFGLGGPLTVMRGDLFEWFRAELGSSDMKKIEAIFSKTGLV